MAEEEAQIRRTLDADDRVMGYHKLRTRQAGSQRHVDVHVMLEDSLRLSEGHAIGEEIEQAIRNTLPNLDVVVHVEPYAEEMSHQAIQHGIFNPNEKAPRLSEGPRHGQPGQTDTVSD